MIKKDIQTKKTAAQQAKQGQNAFNAMTDICGIMVSGSSIDESMGRIASIASGAMNTKACSVMLYDRENQELSVKASQGNVPDLNNKISIKTGSSLSGAAIKEKRIVTTNESGKTGHPILPGTAEFSDIRSMISAPLMYKNEPIGVINAFDSEKRVFTDDEKTTMRAIADQSAAAIQLARFSEEAINAKEALQTRKIIEKAKGILMKQRHLTEEQAYRVMRTKSMDISKSMKEIAEAIILTDEIRTAK
jgi:signal transduction protein with GAF and PtsI domain